MQCKLVPSFPPLTGINISVLFIVAAALLPREKKAPPRQQLLRIRIGNTDDWICRTQAVQHSVFNLRRSRRRSPFGNGTSLVNPPGILTQELHTSCRRRFCFRLVSMIPESDSPCSRLSSTSSPAPTVRASLEFEQADSRAPLRSLAYCA